MLAQLGSTVFEIAPLNAIATNHEAGADYAEKSVMGRRPPLEFVGEGTESYTIQAKLFPAKFGGLSDLDGLQKQRKAGKPLPYMRGDGVPMGWVVIERISTRSSYLDAHGVGQVIEVSITVKRSDPPAGAAIFSILAGIIGL